MKKLLINASFPDEMRIALLEGSRLLNLEVESYDSEAQQNNVYKGQVTNIVPSIDAAFVDFGGARNGFLPLRNIADEFKTGDGGGDSQEAIENLLQVGDELIVQMQVDRGQHENKGALLTTVITLAGQYLEMHPNAPQLRRIQRKIPRRRQETLHNLLQQLEIPAGMGVSLGKESLDAELENLQKEMHLLAGVWEQIQEKAREVRGPALLMREPQGLFRALRDYLNNEVREVLIDTPQSFRIASEWATRNKPEQEHKIIFYDEPTPLFIQYKIEAKVESIHQRKVALPAGGSLIFDHTAAMTTIDVNSGSLHGDDMEDTAFRTNQEAAREIAQQLRFRDIGGQIVIDFIDMDQEKNRQEIERLFRQEMAQDNARPNIGVISDFGLMCMTRKRLRPSADDTFMQICPACDGHGKIRTNRSLAMSILRYIEFEASKQGVTDIHVLTPVDEGLSGVLFNEKRRNLLAIEEEYSVNIAIIPSAQMRFPNYKLQSYREQPASGGKQPEKQSAKEELRKYRKSSRRPVSENRDDAPVSHPYQVGDGSIQKRQKSGWMRSLWQWLTPGTGTKKKPPQKRTSSRQHRRKENGPQNRQRKSQSQRRPEQKQAQHRVNGQQSRTPRSSERRGRSQKSSGPHTETQASSTPSRGKSGQRGRGPKSNRQPPQTSPRESDDRQQAPRSAARQRPEALDAMQSPSEPRTRPPEPGSTPRPPGPAADGARRPSEPRTRPPEPGGTPQSPGPAADEARRPSEPRPRPPESRGTPRPPGPAADGARRPSEPRTRPPEPGGTPQSPGPAADGGVRLNPEPGLPNPAAHRNRPARQRTGHGVRLNPEPDPPNPAVHRDRPARQRMGHGVRLNPDLAHRNPAAHRDHPARQRTGHGVRLNPDLAHRNPAAHRDHPARQRTGHGVRLNPDLAHRNPAAHRNHPARQRTGHGVRLNPDLAHRNPAAHRNRPARQRTGHGVRLNPDLAHRNPVAHRDRPARQRTGHGVHLNPEPGPPNPNPDLAHRNPAAHRNHPARQRTGHGVRLNPEPGPPNPNPDLAHRNPEQYRSLPPVGSDIHLPSGHRCTARPGIGAQ